MTDSIRIVIDSACDLSPEFISDNNIEIIPISIRLKDQVFLDQRKEKETVALYSQEFDKRGIDAESIAYDVDQVTDLLATKVAPIYDGALIITISSTRSPLFENTRKAIFLNLNRFKQARIDAGKEEFFSVRVLDSETLFTGQAILAHEAVRLINEENVPLNKLSTPLMELSKKVYAYILPRDLYFIHHRAKKKGDRSVSWLSYKIGTMFDIKPIIQMHQGETKSIMKTSGLDAALKKLLEHAMRQIKQGLATNLVVISYAGELKEIKNNPLIDQFVAYAKQNNIEVMMSVMSTTGAVNVGSGAFSLAFAAA